jgi:hypothetical protein
MSSFINAMMETNDTEMTCTANGAVAHRNTGEARVDLFSKLLRDTPQESAKEMIDKALIENTLDTIKLLFFKRACRGLGSGEKKIFFEAMKYLLGFPTIRDYVIHNARHIPHFGSWKDIWQIFAGTEYEYVALDHFATQLKEDVEILNNESNKPISLCAKWAPSQNQSWDKKYKLAEKLATLLFPEAEHPLPLYRKHVLVPLRNRLNIVETKMCNREWHHINYSQVPSVCMNRARKLFSVHDSSRFCAWLEDVKNKKNGAKINASQMFPHDLVATYFNPQANVDGVIEEQWKVLVSKAQEQGHFEKCLVLSDVSDSMNHSVMHDTPMKVSVALGILISACTAEPYKNHILTFDTTPQFFKITGDTLKEQVQNMLRSPWGGGTNLQAAFENILQVALQHYIPQKDMPEKLFIISDMVSQSHIYN